MPQNNKPEKESYNQTNNQQSKEGREVRGCLQQAAT